MSQPRVRKDYRALKPAERQRFFYCLQMLQILPPTEPQNKRTFFVPWKAQEGRPTFKSVSPNNIHDQFISSHQTSCEHGMPYFAYYHRHLLICLEMALNYAQEVLLAGPSKLPKDLYEKHKKEFDIVFEKYKDIISKYREEYSIAGDLPGLAIHYWDPTDYTTTFELPEQLREHPPTQIDNLCFAVNQHYAWTFNFATRWFRQLGYVPMGFETNGYFDERQPVDYNADQKRIINGDLTPRDSPRQFFNKTLTSSGYLSLYSVQSRANSFQWFKSLVDTHSTVDRCTVNKNQIDCVFGTRERKLHWISQDERSKMTSSSRNRAYSYNLALPHFQYALALFKDSNQFLKHYATTATRYETSMEFCHNTAHDNLHRFMSDSAFSITHPIFFLFHSWIDLALETKARLVRNSDRSDSEYEKAKDYLDDYKSYSILNQVVNNQAPIKWGQYPIFQWCTPVNKLTSSGLQIGKDDYQAPFAGYGFVLNDEVKGIRLSNQLTSFYQKNYVQSEAHRYKHISNFKNFNFNYNYEIRDYDEKGEQRLRLMQEKQVPIPSFITDIFNDYDSVWNRNRVRRVRVASKNPPKEVKSSAPPPPTSGEAEGGMSSGPVSQPQPVKSSGPPPQNEFGSLSEEDYYNQKDFLKAIRQSFGGLAGYASTVKSAVVPIELQMTEVGFKNIPLSAQHTEVMKEGLVISVLSLLTRGIGAHSCPNCKAEKNIIIECTQNLAQMNEDLFCALARGICQQTIFKIQNDKEVKLNRPSISEMFRLTTQQPIFNSLFMLEGAHEMSFDVFFHGKQNFKDSSVRINGYNFCVQTGQMQTMLSKSSYKLNCTAQFPPIINLAYKQTVKEHFLYRKITIHIINGEEKRHLEFHIKSFHDLIRYRVDIYQREGANAKYLDVTVKDKDFEFKQSHYNNNQYVL